MISLGNLPAAAQLMNHFHLHRDLPPLDPRLVEASARERAAAHLQLPISESMVIFVHDKRSLKYAQQVLVRVAPPGVCGGAGTPFVSCVGLDVEGSPVTNKSALLQVRCAACRYRYRCRCHCPYPYH